MTFWQTVQRLRSCVLKQLKQGHFQFGKKSYEEKHPTVLPKGNLYCKLLVLHSSSTYSWWSLWHTSATEGGILDLQGLQLKLLASTVNCQCYNCQNCQCWIISINRGPRPVHSRHIASDWSSGFWPGNGVYSTFGHGWLSSIQHFIKLWWFECISKPLYVGNNI